MRVSKSTTDRLEPVRIFVAVGTHEQPFQRLLDAVEQLCSKGEYQWRVQYGTGSVGDAPFDLAQDYFDTDDIVSLGYQWADVVVSQASPGIVFSALEAGSWPIVLGRRVSKGEHVDDHQLHFARQLGQLGWATAIDDAGELADAIWNCNNRLCFLKKAAREFAHESETRRKRFRKRFWTEAVDHDEVEGLL